MITTVTLNPAIDRTIIVEECILGQVNRIKSSREDIGGKGINVSKVINLLNGNTTAVGFLGKRNKKQIENFFQREKIQGDFVIIDDKTRINTKVIDLRNMLTTEFNESGFEINKKDIFKIKKKIKEYSLKSNYMVFSGSIPQGCNTEIYNEIIELVKNDTKTVLDADGELLKEGVKANPFLIKPNIDEFNNTFGVKVESIEEVIYKALDIADEYKIKWVLVSMGKKGSVLVSKKKILIAKPIKVKSKSSVGAGDSMLGGFMYSYSKEKNPEIALAYGTACGTLAVTTEGTQMLEKSKIEEIFHKVKIENISNYYL